MPVRRIATSDAATRDRLLDAGLEVLADEGIRGLTHRAIESRSGVSHGVTTYYFGTRDALLEALLERLLAVDGAFLEPARAALDRFEAMARAGAAGSLAAQVRDATGGAAGESRGARTGNRSGGAGCATPVIRPGDLSELMDQSLTTFLSAGRPALARYELFLYAARRPHLQPTVARLRAGILDLAARALALLGAPEPRRGAVLLVAVADGLLLHDLSAPDPVRRAWATSYLMAAVRAAVDLRPPDS